MPPAAEPAASTETVSVRMYRGLLGDCFLLTHARGKRAFHALIDCGVLQCIGDRPLTKAAIGRMPAVVADIKDRTGGRLDLVVATHEHYDHLSGFLLQHEAFKTFSIGAVWVAWTESRTDDQANAIRERGKKALSLLKAVATSDGLGLDQDDTAGKDRRATIEALLQFYDTELEPWTPQDALGAAKKRPPYNPAAQVPRSCANAIEWLRFKAGEANVRYLEPGQVVRFGLNERLRASVLGPPRAGKRLLQLNPSAGGQREVYLTSSDEVDTLETTLRARRLGVAKGATVAPARLGAADQPFAQPFHRTGEEQDLCAIARLYAAEGAENRRIDGEWLGSAELLALKIDRDVNNTSLALAIEVPGPARHVLLFPADAQVGNWLSWHDQTYSETPADPAARTETAIEILSRVVLYKVGHHGSHNATAREKGLELMTSPHLVAMIPVVKAVAREQANEHNKDGWAMPFGHLFDRLKEKTRDRIVLGDGAPDEEGATFGPDSLFQPTYADGSEPLWVELTMTLGDA
jgi:hypothetical protein